MKLLILILSIMLTSNVFANSSKDLFELSITKRTQQKGRFEGVLDNKMLDIAGKLVIVSNRVNNNYKIRMVSNGNKWAHRSNLLYPSMGDIYFSVTEEDLDTESVFELYGEEYRLKERPMTFYIIESDAEYEDRMARIDELNKTSRMKYPHTGRFIGIAEFDISGVYLIDFYEIVDGNKLESAGTFRK